MYCTKYALSLGVIEFEPRATGDADDGYVYAEKGSKLGYWTVMKLRRDAFETKEAAIADANARREKKIKSLEKQIAMLRRMEFKV